MAEENFPFLFVSCGQVVAIGNVRTPALIAGSHLIAVGADQTGGAHHAILLAGRLAAVVCVVFAHLRPVFYAVFAKYGLLRSSFDVFLTQPQHLSGKHTRQPCLVEAWSMHPSSHFDPFFCLQRFCLQR
jgi:hypothetical protein